MRFGYRLNKLLGSVYANGNVLFLPPDGTTVLSPVRNRVALLDLVHHTSRVLPFEARKNITLLSCSHDGRLLVVIDEDGRALLVNIQRRVVLHRLNFKKRVLAVEFSPNDRFIAVAVGKQVQVWYTPGHWHHFAPMTLFRTYGGHKLDVTCLDWAPDGNHLLAGSKDLSARLYFASDSDLPQRRGLKRGRDGVGGAGFVPITLSGHRDILQAVFFSSSGREVYTVARDGAIFAWAWHSDDAEEAGGAAVAAPAVFSTELGQWKLESKHFLRPGKCDIASVAFHARQSLLVVGFSSGIFGLYEMPGCVMLHTLSVGQKDISTCAINHGADWLAFGCPSLGQLLVWEWQSETYVIKQQGHNYGLNSLAFSPNGSVCATGGEDHKLKLWSTTSGFCFVTFADHEAPVTDVAFTSNGSAVLSSSLDGTVRAYDLVRYRNFRTLTTPTPVQLTCLTLDPAGEVVVAGAVEPFEVYVWSLQTGKLLDVFAGHEAPLSALAFSPTQAVMASASWDGTVKLWNVFKQECIETLEHSTDVLAVCFRPDGQEICASTLAGQLQIWDVEEGALLSTIEGRRDIAGGRRSHDMVTAETAGKSAYFTSCAYTADGTCVIAGGESKFVCIYEVSQRILIKKFQVTHNRSLDGVLDQLHSNRLTEAGSLDLLDVSDDEGVRPAGGPRGTQGDGNALPGSKRGQDGSRRSKAEARTTCVRFSPTGQEWAATTTEGLLVYSLDEDVMFDPFELDESITPASVMAALGRREWAMALVMAFHLNEDAVAAKAVDAVPLEQVLLVARALPSAYSRKLLEILTERVVTSRHLEFHLAWCKAALHVHGKWLMTQTANTKCTSVMRGLQRAIASHEADLFKLVDENLYTLNFLSKACED